MPRDSISREEELVMRAILFSGNESYGVEIKGTIEERTKRTISMGAVYAALERLEESGYITSRLGETGNFRGGRAKRYFRVEGAGVDALGRLEMENSALLVLSQLQGVAS